MLAEKGPNPYKMENIDDRPNLPVLDDAKLESMLRYYNIEDNLDALLRYIKSQVVQDKEEEYP